MSTFAALEKLALSFPEVTVGSHFEKISFKVRKKIFATFDDANNRATVKLSIEDQEGFSSEDTSIYRVNNKWGNQGWTFIELGEIQHNQLKKVMVAAYCEVAPKKLAEMVRPRA